MKAEDASDPLMWAQWPAMRTLQASAVPRPSSHPVDLFEGVDEEELAAESRTRIERVQSRIGAGYALLGSAAYRESASQPAPETGFHRKTVVDATYEGTPLGRLIHKPMSNIDAAKCEFVTVLCNLLGVYTPLTLRHEARIEGVFDRTSSGTSAHFLEDSEVVPAYDYRRATPEVFQYVMLSRWINELVGNLHCWWAQYLVPVAPPRRYSAMAMVDMDEAFNSVAPEFLQEALLGYFQKEHVLLEDCEWMDREFSLEDPIAWRPQYYDSCFCVYGYALRDYVLGGVSSDLGACVDVARRSERLPDQVFANAMRGFLEASRSHFKNDWVFLPAARNPKYTISSFRDGFVKRVRRSVEEFVQFLGELEAARNDPGTPMHQYYAAMPERPY